MTELSLHKSILIDQLPMPVIHLFLQDSTIPFPFFPHLEKTCHVAISKLSSVGFWRIEEHLQAVTVHCVIF